MENIDNMALARLCRGQAQFASSEEARTALLELAAIYEKARAEASAVELVEPVAKQPT